MRLVTIRPILPPSLPGLAVPGGLAVRVLDSLGDHRDAWSLVVEATDGASPFAASWWVERVEPDRAAIVAVFDGERLVGGVALSARPWMGTTRLQMLGEGIAAPDHCDVVAASADRADVERALTRWFSSLNFVFDGVGIDQGSALARCLSGAREILWSTAPYLPMQAGGVPQPVSSRVKNTIKRTRKRLVRDHAYETRIIGTDAAEAHRSLDDLLRLHRLRWPDGSRFATTFDRLKPALAEGMAAGAVQIHEGVAGDRVVASMVFIDQAHRRSYYQGGREMGHEWRGVGTVLMADVIADAHDKGMTEFDFLRGSESYKLDWTSHERQLVRLIAARGMRERALAGGLFAVGRSKPTLRRLRDRSDRTIGSLRESFQARRRPVP